MQSAAPRSFTDTPGKNLLWALLAIVALVQVVALYKLCGQQVQKAQLREALMSEQQMAATDCLGYSGRASTSGCRSQAFPFAWKGDGAPTLANVGSIIPAGFSVR